MPFEKQAAGKDAILFSDDEHRVYAISKLERGLSYTLDQSKFDYLVTSVRGL